MPTLYLMVGLPGSGKTTRATELEAQHSALRLCPDEWIVPLFGTGERATAAAREREVIEGLLWTLAARALSLGVSVILENGFWRCEERQDYRRRAAALGAACLLVYLNVPLEELWARLERRNLELPPDTIRVRRNDLEEWYPLFERPMPDKLTSKDQA